MTQKCTFALVLVGIPALMLLATPAPAGARAKVKTVHRTISATTAHDYWLFHKQTNFQYFEIIDLRSPKAHARGRIPGAKNLEANKHLRGKLNRLSKTKAYMIYCRNGKVGKRTMALMKKLRFRTVYNIQDGIIAWNRRKYEIKRGTGDN